MTLARATPTTAGDHPLPMLVMIYLVAVAILLPVDWFAPTGELFREFGAKPATVLLTAGGLLALLLPISLTVAARMVERRVVALFVIWLFLGSAAFFLNITQGWSDWHYSRNPATQFVTQSALILAGGIAVLGNARLAIRYRLIEGLGQMLPWVAGLHLIVFFLDATEVLQRTSGPLLLFRTYEGLMARPTGLTSEPAYFGTLAALFGTALLYLKASGPRRAINIALAVALYCSAIAIMGKTLFVVAAAQALFLIFRRDARLAGRAVAMLLLGAVAAGVIYFAVNFAALDVGENESATHRLGAPLLAMNAIASGYGLIGIGTGQFHFFYREEFAPDFLFLSYEALNQFSPTAETRASTFNLYVRILLELGMMGALLFVAAIYALFRVQLPRSQLFVHVLLAGALGFLLTQDTYLYPPLIFATALILGSTYRNSATLAGSVRGGVPNGRMSCP